MDHATNEFIQTLSRAREGDEVAFASIVEEQRVRLFRHCYRMLGSGPEAEEAVQDTLLKAWQRLSTFEARGSFPGWLYRIATNICIDRLRGRSARSHPVSYGPARGARITARTCQLNHRLGRAHSQSVRDGAHRPGAVRAPA